MSDKEKLLKKMMAQKGLAVPGETTQPSKTKRSSQLDNFLRAVGQTDRLVNLSLPDNSSAATVERTLANAGGFQDAYLDDSRVMFVGNAVCSEISLALDFIPFNGQILSYFLAAAGASRPFLDIAEKNNLSRDLCPVVRCVLGAAIEDCLPSPDFISFAYFPCDSGAKIFYALSEMYECPWFLLDMPHRHDNRSVAHLAHRTKEMVIHMENTLGISAAPDRIASAVKQSKEALRYYDKLVSLSAARQICPSVHNFTTDIITHFNRLGSGKATEGIRLCYEDLQNLAETKEKNNRKDRPRVIWDGVVPFSNNEIIRYIEEVCGLEVMANIMPALTKNIDELLAEDDPYMYMAKRQMYFTGVDNTKFDNLDLYGIDGVIRINQWGCRRHLSVNQITRDRLRKVGIAMLEIDGDFIDSRGYSFSQVKIRIDAFAEMLKNRSSL